MPAQFGQLPNAVIPTMAEHPRRVCLRRTPFQSYIGDLERGSKSPTLEVIDALAAALRAAPGTLVEAAARRSGRTPAEKQSLERARQRVRTVPVRRKLAQRLLSAHCLVRGRIWPSRSGPPGRALSTPEPRRRYLLLPTRSQKPLSSQSGPRMNILNKF